MFKKITGFIAGVAIATTAAQAGTTTYSKTTSLAFTPVYGKTLPPIGYVNFCARNQSECKNIGGKVKTATLTAARWDAMNQINTYSNKTVRPVTDSELFGVPEYWTYPTSGAGDCEDYVLQKKRYLEGLGFPAETLLITVVLDKKGLGHAVLTVRTDRGDFILDNMQDKIYRWSDTGYTFIKRQSQKNPVEWVSLNRAGTRVSLTTVAGRR